ncbi:hypothetical protein [Chondromyces apiculatus]|uniref:Uncharacterized protein n=1 Tax=Chondromyces apiculatus DSM 436 TaxID=1192034 RepID=A0A017T2U5_9BACT|nr:hypothetical protein [Chondromyces apiculatus]EYF03332.1 Hypothetical protein CAP_5663 [Chondromyces apiculatus DSM 436]
MSGGCIVRTGLAALLACASGCFVDKGGTTPLEGDPPFEHPGVGAEGIPGVGPEELGGGALQGTSRSVRRMTIDTLQASMRRVAGNDIAGNPILWRFNNRDGFSDAAFGKALGRPDFQSSTEEGTVSNALYVKFVGDAARDICTQMAKNDLVRLDAGTRALFPAAPVDGSATEAQITANLQYLVLRFLGLRVAASDELLPALRGVYDAGVESVASPAGSELTPAAEGWRGVCVALFESPLFHND